MRICSWIASGVSCQKSAEDINEYEYRQKNFIRIRILKFVTLSMLGFPHKAVIHVLAVSKLGPIV